jgi:hypothetical protein
VETLGSDALSIDDPAVRVIPEGRADRGDIVFQMKLAAAPASADDTSDAAKVNAPKPGDLSEPAPQLLAPAPPDAPARETEEPAGRQMVTDSASESRPHTKDPLPEESADAKAPYHGAAEPPMSPAGSHTPSGGSSSGGHESRDSGAAEHLEATQPPLPPEPPKSTDAARNIRLELSGGDQRVEVRLMDRGGEIQVAVRTADSHLAGTLRENLPALSARLSENGFHTESPQDSGLQQHRDSREQHARQQQQQQQEQQQHPDRSKQKGKDFEWLMSTLR